MCEQYYIKVQSVSEVLGKLLDSRKSYIASSRGQGNAWSALVGPGPTWWDTQSKFASCSSAWSALVRLGLTLSWLVMLGQTWRDTLPAGYAWSGLVGPRHTW